MGFSLLTVQEKRLCFPGGGSRGYRLTPGSPVCFWIVDCPVWLESQKSSQAPCRPIYVEPVSSLRLNKHQRLPGLLSEQVPMSTSSWTSGECRNAEQTPSPAPRTLRISFPARSLHLATWNFQHPPRPQLLSSVPSFSSTTPVSSLNDLILMFSSLQCSEEKNRSCPQREGVGKLI